MENNIVYEYESTAEYICRLCRKSFFNANALQNHKNMHHDMEVSTSDDDQNIPCPILSYDKQDLNDVCEFKFIPLNKNFENDHCSEDGLITRNFNEDISYLIVKVEDNLDADAVKKRRLEGVVKRTLMRPGKQPVDLRGPFTCTFPSTIHPDLQCHQIFFNCCEYSMHYRETHTKRRKAALRCQVCEKRLDRDLCPNTLAAQMQEANILTFSCRVCGQTFLNGAEFDEHNRLMHAKMKPHQCSICSKRFTQQGGLQQHMRMHTGIRPFPCTFCSKAFTQKAGLDQHLRTHTKIKPFKCVICNKCFSQSVHLRQHMRTHTNIQPFECSICGRRFKQSSHLNFHMRSHMGEDSLVVERYAQAVQQQSKIEFLNLSNLQPVQDGETMYYAAELAAGPKPQQQRHNYDCQSLIILPEHVLGV